MAAVFVACGKRGDPLPPLRPIPAPAEAFTIRQVGDVIRLEWMAPSVNQDGSTENVLLRDVDVRRRIIDLPAFIEEQTQIITPKDPEGTEEVTIDPLTGEPVEAAPETESAEEPPPASRVPPVEPDAPDVPDVNVRPDPLGEEEEAEDTVAAEERVIALDEVLEQAGLESQDALELLSDLEPLATEPAADLGPPPLPRITIPAFAPNSRPLVTLKSTVLGERMSYDDPIDPAWIGQRVEYAVIYTNQKNRRGPRSKVLQIDPAEALPPPPGAPVAKSDDLFVALSWPAAPEFPAPDQEEEAVDPDTIRTPPSSTKKSFWTSRITRFSGAPSPTIVIRTARSTGGRSR